MDGDEAGMAVAQLRVAMAAACINNLLYMEYDQTRWRIRAAYLDVWRLALNKIPALRGAWFAYKKWRHPYVPYVYDEDKHED